MSEKIKELFSQPIHDVFSKYKNTSLESSAFKFYSIIF